MRISKQNKGFTLLEVLLVIAAIGILASIVLVAINPNRQLEAARNAKRRSDINTITKAIQQYSIDNNGQYPVGIETGAKAICRNGTPVGCIDLSILAPTYLASIPEPDSNYYYVRRSNNNIEVRHPRDEIWNIGGNPSLDLDFANNKSLIDSVSGNNLINFTRNSIGTYVGEDRLIKTAGVNEPRFDHNPTTGESLGLLVEEQRTNLLLRSEEFDNASWTQPFLSENITANSTTAPNGLTVADTVSTVNATAEFGVGQSATVTANIPGTVSIFAKAASSDFVYVRYYGASTNLFYTIIVDLSTGVVTNTRTGSSTTAVSHSVISLPNGWYRISLTATHNSANQFLIAGPCLTSTQTIGPDFGEVTSAGTGSESIYLWGAQLEAGAFPTSYIPTTTAAATRSADVCSLSGSNFSSWYRQDEGTFFAETIYRNDNNGPTVFISDGSYSNLVSVQRDLILDRWQADHHSAGSRQALLNLAPNSCIVGQVSKIATTVKLDNYAASANGGSVVSDNLGSLPVSLSRVSLGSDNVGSSAYINGTIRRLTYWPQRLDNEVLQLITQ